MKFCTLVQVAASQDTGIIGVDAVDDAHRFGLSADGQVRHAEGWPGDRKIRAGGMVRGRMADLYAFAEPEPMGHPEGTPEAT